tara:strand:- start:1925 stop:2071 length:147 start_codon:yes stop_codon:yes gene_type:complete
MISEIIRAVTKGEIKEGKKNVVAFGLYQYPKTLKQVLKQFKQGLWLRK